MKFADQGVKNTRIFLAPLDWGLGHTTRCIPLIQELLKQNFEVFVGASGKNAALLQKEFPDLPVIPLTGYRINYAKSRRFFMLWIFLQLPKMLFSIVKEHLQIRKIVNDYQIDVVISDNRLGCYHKKVQTVFITHQLQILTGHQLFDRLARACNYFFINRFTECWVPDLKGEINLAGLLSHPVKMPEIAVRYIGCLSRFKHLETETNIPLTVLISGPEPQRTNFENVVVTQLLKTGTAATIVRGLPGEEAGIVSRKDKIVFINHMRSMDLQTMLLQSEMIIARSGYSTVMDLVALRKKALLIPTPGQTEQEYLAEILMKKRLFFTVSQDAFDLSKHLQESKAFTQEPLFITTNLQEALHSWKATLT